jgi:hexosaminidase
MGRTAAIAIALLHAVVAAGAHAADVSLVPNPAFVAWKAGRFTLSAATPIVIPEGDAEASRAAPVLADRIRRTRGLALTIEPGPPRDGAIVFDHDDEGSDASYELDVSPARVTIHAHSLAGFAYGATTLWQLAGTGRAASAAIPAVHIEDAPRFAWRGLLLDSARHFQSTAFVERFIDTMAAHKLNVLQWHLTDDEGWRIEIRKYPRLTSVGAWRVPAGRAAHADLDSASGNPRLHGGYYTQDDARRIVAYAAARGVMVVPEIDMPGHVPADSAAHSGVLNLEESTFGFVEDVLTEVMSIFPGPYIHIGGAGIDDASQIQRWITRNSGRFLEAHGRRLVGWDEVVDPDLPRGAVVMSRRGTKSAIAASALGHDGVIAVDPELSFDHRQTASPAEPPGREPVVSLEDVYRFDPVPPGLDRAQRAHIRGLQGNLWSELIATEARMGWMAFPRAAALAEVGWSQHLDWTDFRRRVASMPARYEALGMTYARTAFEPPGIIQPWRRTATRPGSARSRPSSNR